MGEIITAGHRNHEAINEMLTKYAAKMWAAEARIAGAEAMMDAMVMETPVKPGPKSKYQHHAYGCYTDSSGTVHTGIIPGEGPHVEYWRGTWLAAESLPLLTEEEIQTMWDDDAFASGRVHPDPMDYQQRYIEVDW